MVPLLVIVSVGLGLLGGYVACGISRDVSTADYVAGSLTQDFNPVIVTVCGVKATVFGFIITSICAYQGFYTSRGVRLK